MIGRAQLYERGEIYVVVPLARTEAGYCMSVEPAERLSVSVEDQELGAAVRRAYERPQPVVPTPDLSSSEPSIATVGAGCKSDREFMKGTRMVSVWAEDGLIALAPSARRGTSGFDFLDEVEVDYVDDEQLGAALREALELSR